jgi:pyruvate/2-oxoacid:ferredoxin oxidoreductase alpha subunit/NAD-dependent dihydropyrimidine dehydrogenase PreA subunit
MQKTNTYKPKPVVIPEYCKGCGRCIEACPKHCFHYSSQINPVSGLIPVEVDLSVCNACGLCFEACPEPYGMQPFFENGNRHPEDESIVVTERPPMPKPAAIPSEKLPLGQLPPLFVKGTYAAAIGAILAGCRHFYGYPITPSTEGAELMAKLLPKLDGVFVQAVSEVATVNMIYGCGGAGLPCMTFTSSPGFSLMLEGISYLIGAEVPGVIVNIMRGGPGLGNIGPEQADIKLVCRGLGHGNTHAIVLAAASPQEMLDLTMLAFELTFKYRNPVILVGDGYLGQISGKVTLPNYYVKPGLPDWAVYGDAPHRRNLISSIALSEQELEAHNRHLNEKYEVIRNNEQRADLYQCDDAEVLIIAANTPARMAKGAIKILRERGIPVGLFRPITLWPFPIDLLRPLLKNIHHIVVVEASNGQLEDELRLALSHADVNDLPKITHIRHFGGVLPQVNEIVEKIEQEIVLSHN